MHRGPRAAVLAVVLTASLFLAGVAATTAAHTCSAEDPKNACGDCKSGGLASVQ
jgi:hypothetical protein